MYKIRYIQEVKMQKDNIEMRLKELCSSPFMKQYENTAN